MKEKALRETQIRSIHEMGEQERMNYLNDSWRIPRSRVEIVVENVHTFPVNQQGFQVRDLC